MFFFGGLWLSDGIGRCSFPLHDYVRNLSRMLLLIHVFHPGAVLNSVFKGLGKPCYFESPSGNLWYPVVKPGCTMMGDDVVRPPTAVWCTSQRLEVQARHGKFVQDLVMFHFENLDHVCEIVLVF